MNEQLSARTPASPSEPTSAVHAHLDVLWLQARTLMRQKRIDQARAYFSLTRPFLVLSSLYLFPALLSLSLSLSHTLSLYLSLCDAQALCVAHCGLEVCERNQAQAKTILFSLVIAEAHLVRALLLASCAQQ